MPYTLQAVRIGINHWTKLLCLWMAHKLTITTGKGWNGSLPLQPSEGDVHTPAQTQSLPGARSYTITSYSALVRPYHLLEGKTITRRLITLKKSQLDMNTCVIWQTVLFTYYDAMPSPLGSALASSSSSVSLIDDLWPQPVICSRLHELATSYISICSFWQLWIACK